MAAADKAAANKAATDKAVADKAAAEKATAEKAAADKASADKAAAEKAAANKAAAEKAAANKAAADKAAAEKAAADKAAADKAAADKAGRALMLIASADKPQKPVTSLGSTVWSLIPAASGQPATVAVKAEANIPDLKMHATMTLRKNTDPTLQATHTIDLKFSFADGAPITGFKDVGLPQMRMEELDRRRSADQRQGQDQRHLFRHRSGQKRYRHRPQPRTDEDTLLVRLPAAAQRRPHRQGRVPEIA